MLRYIELKSGYSDDGPAWIALVRTSKSGKTIYFNGMALIAGQGIQGNYSDPATGDEYWVSGVKKRGSNRWGGSPGEVLVERRAVEEYTEHTGREVPDRLVVDIPDTDPQDFYDGFNEVWSEAEYQTRSAQMGEARWKRLKPRHRRGFREAEHTE